jgi:hypothetical protein
MTNTDMTFTALAKRADEVLTCNTVSHCLGGGEDDREVTVFMNHDMSTRPNGDDYESRLEGKLIIGVALCDLDDPQAAIEILDRDQAAEFLGSNFITHLEEVE